MHDPNEGQPLPTGDLVFRLVPENAPPSGYPEITPPAPVPEQALLTGTMSIIARDCAGCHGPGLMGGGMAPGLLNHKRKYATDDASLRKVIVNGLPDLGMQPNPQLTPEQVTAIIEYLHHASTPKRQQGYRTSRTFALGDCVLLPASRPINCAPRGDSGVITVIISPSKSASIPPPAGARKTILFRRETTTSSTR